MKTLLGIGNALVDTIYTSSPPVALQQEGIVFGIPNHISPEICAKVLEMVKGIPYSSIPGGGAANTVATAALLGMKSTFLGKVGNDSNGDLFAANLCEYGVETHLIRGNAPTGCTMMFPQDNGIPGTFIVSIGAAGEFLKGDISLEILNGYEYLHVEGFLLNCGDIAEYVLHSAHERGIIISFDLGSKGVVDRHRKRVERIVEQYADIVFANENEAVEFIGNSGKIGAEGIAAKMHNGGIAAVKMGSAGSVLACGNFVCPVAPHPVQVVDTLGAGDAYAAGFLYAHSRGASLQRCGEAASITAAGAVGVPGPKIDKDIWETVKVSLQGIAL